LRDHLQRLRLRWRGSQPVLVAVVQALLFHVPLCWLLRRQAAMVWECRRRRATQRSSQERKPGVFSQLLDQLREITTSRYLERHGVVPRRVERVVALLLKRSEQARHRVQMLPGTLRRAWDALPGAQVGALRWQSSLEAETEDKGGIGEVVCTHVARVYKRALPHPYSSLASYQRALAW
jgi:hypothetical protein